VDDFKTSEVKDKYTFMYARQLHVYRDILMYPKTGNPQVVSHLSLLCVTPVKLYHQSLVEFARSILRTIAQDSGTLEFFSQRLLKPLDEWLALLQLPLERKAFFEMKVTSVPIAIDDDWWRSFLIEVIRLLEGPDPDSGNCHWCKVQRLEAAV
jgi:hypothetical protein